MRTWGPGPVSLSGGGRSHPLKQHRLAHRLRRSVELGRRYGLQRPSGFGGAMGGGGAMGSVDPLVSGNASLCGGPKGVLAILRAVPWVAVSPWVGRLPHGLRRTHGSR